MNLSDKPQLGKWSESELHPDLWKARVASSCYPGRPSLKCAVPHDTQGCHLCVW